MRTVAILIPTTGRQDRLERVVQDASHLDANVYLIMDPWEAIQVPGATTLTRREGFQQWARALNFGYRKTTEPLLFTGADDLHFHPDWLEKAQARLSDRIKVVGTNDLSGAGYVENGIAATHVLVDRSYLDDPGGVWDEGPGSFLCELYHHACCESELIDTATKRGAWAPCLESHVEHLHPFWGKAGMDKTYELTMPWLQADNRLYASRCHEYDNYLEQLNVA